MNDTVLDRVQGCRNLRGLKIFKRKSPILTCRGISLRKQRDQSQAELRKAVAARQPELQGARRKSQESAAHLRDVEHAVLSPEQIKLRPKALEAYVPLDPFVERDRLLATLKSE